MVLFFDFIYSVIHSYSDFEKSSFKSYQRRDLVLYNLDYTL